GNDPECHAMFGEESPHPRPHRIDARLVVTAAVDIDQRTHETEHLRLMRSKPTQHRGFGSARWRHFYSCFAVRVSLRRMCSRPHEYSAAPSPAISFSEKLRHISTIRPYYRSEKQETGYGNSAQAYVGAVGRLGVVVDDCHRAGSGAILAA